jgi:nitric oxide reductase NorQ protein
VTATTKPKYILPNGREYLARALGGYSDDVEGLREMRTLGVHTLLLGDPGTGKTALLQAAFPDAENEIGHSKMTAWDMLWRPRPLEDGSIKFDPAPLTRAALNGKPLYVDEIMRMNEDALTPLFSAMDGRGFIVGGNLDGTDLPVAEGFVVIGASNPMVRNAFLPDAIASRFHILSVETDESLLKRLKLDERLVVAWKNLKAMDGGETWKPSIRELLAAQRFLNVGKDAQAAYALTGYRIPARDRVVVANVIAPLLGVRVGEHGGVIK